MNNKYICKAKRKDNGKWIYGDLIIDQYGKYYIHPNANAFSVNEYNLAKCIQMIEIIPETVGQCTGLKDKNGKLIFEGDIVKADGYIFTVKFGKCGGVANNENYGYMGYYLDGFDSIAKDVLRFGLRNDICYFTDIEVIGNIHDDNPELLEEER